MTPRKTARGKAVTSKTTTTSLARTPNIKISFSTTNPSDKPPISTAKARQLVKKIEAIAGRKVVTADSKCDEAVCAQIAELIGRSLDQFAVCTHSCQWFYSKGGGWRLECYFRCKGQYLTAEGTFS
jgi:hypothetical protein